MVTKENNWAEDRFQSEMFLKHWNYYPHERKRFCCINNNSRNAIEGNRNKAKGVIEGVSDTFYLQPNGRVVWLEFKIPGGIQSAAQKDWQRICESLGHTYKLIWCEDDFWKAIGLPKPQ